MDSAREDDARRMANGEPSYYEEVYGRKEGDWEEGREGGEMAEGVWEEEEDDYDDGDDDDVWDKGGIGMGI